MPRAEEAVRYVAAEPGERVKIWTDDDGKIVKVATGGRNA